MNDYLKGLQLKGMIAVRVNNPISSKVLALNEKLIADFGLPDLAANPHLFLAQGLTHAVAAFPLHRRVQK